MDALGGVVNQAAVHRTVQALLVAGACRIANSLAKEAQGPMFTPIAQVCPGLPFLGVLVHAWPVWEQQGNHRAVRAWHACLQASGRRVAYHTFSHVLDLDISFHLERRTGALSRILERGAGRPTRPFSVLQLLDTISALLHQTCTLTGPGRGLR